MNKPLCLYFSLLPILSMQAQSIGSTDKGLRMLPPPVRQLPSSGEAHNDYFTDRGVNEQYAWSIRDHSWVPTPRLLLFGFYAGLISGPHVLRPGVTQEYSLACASHYKGAAKYVWRMEPAPFDPSKVGGIYEDDEVEIEWEIRTSPGVRVVTQPEFPSKLRYWEPLTAPFKIEVSGDSVQRVEIYANGYRNGKLVGFSWIPLILNRDGYTEQEEEREKQEIQSQKRAQSEKHADWRQAPLSEGKIKLMKQEFENRHSLTKRYRTEGLRAGEFLTDTEDPKKR